MKTPQDIVNESGYPLQVSIEHAVNSSRDSHLWTVISHEFPWVNPNTREQEFIDLLQERDGGVWKMIVECKHRSGSWIFLSPGKSVHETKQAKLLFCGSQSQYELLWTDMQAVPKSSESAFCAQEIKGQKDGRPLEGIVGGVLLSVEAVARTEVDLRGNGAGWMGRFYIPVVVTTAALMRLVFDAANIQNGKIDGTKSELEEVPFIRFTKSLITSVDRELPMRSNLMDVYKASERTVFVVEANHFVEFLVKFRVL